jgi:alpha-glucosidase (family GH31 glycosyl hydrolase)
VVDVVGRDLMRGRSGDGLGDAFRTASATFFPASGKTPALQMLRAPQYNSWIEMPNRPTQEGVLAYAQGLLDAGFPPGVLMIDDRWSTDYGSWDFDSSAFADPTAMVQRLHALGFTVMLWLVPFVSPDSATFRFFPDKGSWSVSRTPRRRCDGGGTATARCWTRPTPEPWTGYTERWAG